MAQQITGVVWKAMVFNAAAAIETHKTEINNLNVFPVPDGDTGTNMSLTMGAGAKAMKAADAEALGRVAELTANALLRGARGNSGVILSLLFRGTAKHLKDCEAADAATIAAALSDGVEAAYRAVMKPTEGTILTVSRLAAEEAVRVAETESDIITVLTAALEAGYVALANTIELNPVLKKAGVIDAGGKGYLYILDGMIRALRGETLSVEGGDTVARAAADFSDFDTGDITFTYCTEFIVSRQSARDPSALRAFLDARGDSVVVVDDDEIIKVHVHSNEPGVILTEALTYGQLLSVKIENMREQHTEKLVQAEEARTNLPAAVLSDKQYGAVAVCTGSGMEDVFRDLGADGIITGGQTMNPSTEDILAKIEQTQAETVFVFPNNKNIIMAATQAVPLSSKKVIVIPSKTIPQGVSAMLALDPTLDEAVNVEAMTNAIEAVRTAQITLAARDSVFDGRDIREGEYLALLEDSLVLSCNNLADIADALVTSLAETSPEFVTVFTGEDATATETDTLRAAIKSTLGNAEMTVVYGGQPVYKFVISAE
ncbi:MAG: DAK2 domain-containing protein [Oscillospiraceae bacterium]|jgi:DAK2 domain fusion protein YloV|nr:DAK2 domain-containing protein [Oscillospiraceae bacterium]